MIKRKIPKDSYLIAFVMETVNDEWFRKSRSKKAVKEMVLDELNSTNIYNIDPDTLSVIKLKSGE